LPFLITSGQAAFVAAIVLALASLFVVGALVSIVTGRSMILSGLRQVLIGAAAAAVTYAVGKAIGATVG
jgi:VIT1/CCC1 family predicted Fe2+/Mn2+ transporter